MTVLWLDLKNTYESIPHSLVEETLKRHHVPNKITEIIVDYYNDFQMRTVPGNMLIKATEVECRGPTTRSGLRHPPI